jgi:hypothetical protein
VAALIYVLKIAVEKTLATKFDEYKKQIDLRLQRRSNFEERVLLDRYALVQDIQKRIEQVITDLNRAQHGIDVAGLITGSEVIALTEISVMLENNRSLIEARFYVILKSQAQLVLSFAKASEPDARAKYRAEYVAQREAFHLAMNDVFGLDRI